MRRSLVLVAAFLVAGQALVPDFSALGYYDITASKAYHTGVPPAQQVVNSGQVKTFVKRGRDMTEADLFNLQRDCVNRINEYRTGTRKWSNGNSSPRVPLSALGYRDEAVQCMQAASLGDLLFNVAWNNNGNPGTGAGQHFANCPSSGGPYSTGAEVPGYTWGAGASGGSDTTQYWTYSAVQTKLYSVLQAAWDEGQNGGDITGTRYDSMSDSSYTRAACGFSWTNDGRFNMAARLSDGTNTYGDCDCTGKSASDDAGCGGPLCVNPSVATTLSPTPPTTNPTRAPTKAPTTRTPTKNPTPPTTQAPTNCAVQSYAAYQVGCNNNYILDCNGVCWWPGPDYYVRLGNGICNDFKSGLGMDMNCSKFCFDGCDCGGLCAPTPGPTPAPTP